MVKSLQYTGTRGNGVNFIQYSVIRNLKQTSEKLNASINASCT